MLNEIISYAFLALQLVCGIAILVRFRGSPGTLLRGLGFGTWVATNITRRVLFALEVQ